MLCMICDDEKSEMEMMQSIVSDYAGEHPEHKREVEEWILKKGISVADMGVEE